LFVWANLILNAKKFKKWETSLSEVSAFCRCFSLSPSVPCLIRARHGTGRPDGTRDGTGYGTGRDRISVPKVLGTGHGTGRDDLHPVPSRPESRRDVPIEIKLNKTWNYQLNFAVFAVVGSIKIKKFYNKIYKQIYDFNKIYFEDFKLQLLQFMLIKCFVLFKCMNLNINLHKFC